MRETPEEMLRKSLDCFWKELGKKTKEGIIPEAEQFLKDAEAKLNRSEELLSTGLINEASKTAIQAGNFLRGLDLRCAIICFRKANEANESQQKGGDMDKERARFLDKASKILAHAEQLLNEGKIKEAKLTLQEYHRQKIRIFGPPIFGPF